MKVVTVKKPEPEKKLVLKASEIPVGSVFTAESPAAGDRGTYLKGFDVVVSLEDPSDTWESKSVVFRDIRYQQAELRIWER